MSTAADTRAGHDATVARRLGAALVGIGFGFAVEVMTKVKLRLSATSNAEAAAWPIWLMLLLFTLLGVAAAAVVLTSPREPWLATGSAAVLLYGLVASVPTTFTWNLPYPGEREFVLVPTMAGVLTATAVWSWWAARRRRRSV